MDFIMNANFKNMLTLYNVYRYTQDSVMNISMYIWLKPFIVRKMYISSVDKMTIDTVKAHLVLGKKV